MAGISDDIDKLQVNRADFLQALDEVHPAFGVSEEETRHCRTKWYHTLLLQHRREFLNLFIINS